MKWNVGTKIAIGFGLALAIFVIVGVVSYRGTTQLIAGSDSRKHTYEVLGRLEETLSLLQDVEIGQRGYALTGEESYLESYQTALGKIDKSLQEVRKLTEDNLRQQRRLARGARRGYAGRSGQRADRRLLDGPLAVSHQCQVHDARRRRLHGLRLDGGSEDDITSFDPKTRRRRTSRHT